MRLNPRAAEFVPATSWVSPYTGWGLKGHDARASADQTGLSCILQPASDPAFESNIMDLPEEVITYRF